jgi:hypothetical protein
MLKANLFHADTYKGADLDKLKRALQLLESTINSDKFKTAVLNFKSFQFVRYKCFFGIKSKPIQLKEYTNAELYEVIMKGHRQEGDDTFMDLKLKLSEAGGRSAVGETDGNDIITTYRAAFDDMSDAELAAHLTHEWTHTMDFEHSYSDGCDPTRNCLSVPYAIGNIIEIILTGECWYGCKYETLNT